MNNNNQNSNNNYSDKYKQIQLQYPITVDRNGNKITLSMIKMERVKVKHLKCIPASLFAQNEEERKNINPTDFIPLFAVLTGLSETEIAEIDISDLGKFIENLNDFFGQSPAAIKK